MNKLILYIFLISGTTLLAQTKVQSKKMQIKMATQAAPEMYRDQATVLGYNKQHKLVTLKKGNNDMICLADDPDEKGIKVVCYNQKLEPFMARGRALKAEGKSEAEKRKIRQNEIDKGVLKMPSEPAALYVMTAKDKDFDETTGEIKNAYTRYVLYKPNMTPEETGLSTKPAGAGIPWLMDAGTARSHIMISPSKKEN